jgi:hypothetical protein
MTITMTANFFKERPMEPFEATAVINSLSANEGPNHPNGSNTDIVTILDCTDSNNVIAEYKGKRCRAIFNVFVGMYYVDDKFGLLPECSVPEK